jgi:hypothetical protein
MKRLSLSLLFMMAILATTVFSSFKNVNETSVGYQQDATYNYYVLADLSGSSPFPITRIIVQRLIGGKEETVQSVSGAVTVGIHTSIFGTATVVFTDVDTNQTITKTLTGALQGGILP